MIKKSITISCLAILSLTVITGGLGCGGGVQAKAAKISLRLDEQSRYTTNARIIEITDASEVVRLTSFFPGLGKGRWSPVEVATLWQAYVIIEFEMEDGRMLKIYSNFEKWTDGKGSDISVRPGLRDHVFSLFEAREGK